MSETILNENAFLVSQTDEKGVVTFANEEFCKVAGYSKEELIGQNHSIVRHQDMPKAAFEDLWKTVKAGNVWQGYVKNKTKQGGYYWVFATVYPFKCSENKTCYISCRRKPKREEVNKAIELYKTLR